MLFFIYLFIINNNKKAGLPEITFIDYIEKNCCILQCFDSNDMNKDVHIIHLKFEIISKAGLPEFLLK